MTQGIQGWNQQFMFSAFQKEATYAAGKTHTGSTSCSFLGAEFEDGNADVIANDKGEMTGKEHGNDQKIIEYRNNPVVKFPQLRPNDLAAFASLILGSSTPTKDGAATAYRHRIIPVTTGTALPSGSAVHLKGGIQTEYKGIKGRTLKISGEQEKFIAAEFGLSGSGQRASNAAAFAAAITELWLHTNQLKIFLETGANISIAASPTQGEENISSATPDDLSVRGRSFEASFDNKSAGQPGFGGGGYLQDDCYGRRTAAAKATIQFASAAEIAYFTAQDACAIQFEVKSSQKIDPAGTMYYGFGLIIPRAKIKAYPVPKGGVGDTLTQDFDFEIMDDGTNPAWILDVYTAQAAYLAAA